MYEEEPRYGEEPEEAKPADFSIHPNPLEIPRLIMEREARKKKEYAERTKMDVKKILGDQEAYEIRVADKDQEDLFRADPSRGEGLKSAEQVYDGED
jgi:hypothetical protein